MEPREDEDLMALLAQPAPLDDDGFTARVMEQLPRRQDRTLRPYILVFTTLLACLCGLLVPSIRETISSSVLPLFNLSLPLAAGAVLLVLGVMTWLVVAEET